MANRGLQFTISGDPRDFQQASRKTVEALATVEKMVQEVSHGTRTLTDSQKRQILEGARQRQETMRQERALKTLGLTQAGLNRHINEYGQRLRTGKTRAEESVVTNAALTGSFKSMARAAVTAGAGFAAAYVGLSKAKEAVHATEELAHSTLGLERAFGLSTKAASEWSAVATARGMDPSKLSVGFTKLAKSVEAYQQGSKPAVSAFKELGLSQSDVAAGQHDFQGLLEKTMTAFGRMEGGTRKAALAQTLFGRSYKQLLPLLSSGDAGFAHQAALAEKYGATLNGHSIKSTEDLIAAQRELKFAQLGLQIQFTEKIAPALLDVEHAGAKVVAIFRDPHLTDDQKWKKLGDTLGPLGKKLEKGFEQALPKIADAAGNAAPHVAAAFVNGFLHAGPLGRLAIGAWLLKRMGGIGAFTAIGSAGAQGTAAGFKGRLGSALKGVGIASVLSGALSSAGGGGNALDHAQNFASGFTWGLVKSVKQQLDDNTKKVMATWQHDMNSGAYLSSPRAGNASAVRTVLVNLKYKLKTRDPSQDPSLKLLRSAGFGNQGAPLTKTTTLSYRVKGMNFLDAANHTLDELRKTTSRVDKTKLEAYALQIQRVGNDIGLMKNGAITDLKTLRKVATDNMKRIAATMGTNSAAGRDALSQNARAAVDNLKSLMHSGVITQRQGMREIRRIWSQTLQGFGFDPKSALNIAKGNSYTGGREEGTSGIKYGKERGGFVGGPGMVGPDSVPMMLPEGQPVLNRWQMAALGLGFAQGGMVPTVVAPGEYLPSPDEARGLDARAAEMGYGGLAGLFSAISRPHGYSQGGTVGAAVAGGAMSRSAVDAVRKRAGLPPIFDWIALAESADRPGIINSIGATGLWQIYNHPDLVRRFGSMTDPWHNAQAAKVLYDQSGLSPWVSSRSVWGKHLGAGALTGGGGGAASFKNVKAPRLGGPASVLKSVVQGSLSSAASAANKSLRKAAAASGGGMGAGTVGGARGPSGVGSWNGIQVADWLINALQWAKAHGGNTAVTSGYRPGRDPHTASGSSEHQGTRYPHGAIDFGGMIDPPALTRKLSFLHSLRGYSGPKPILPIGFRDDGHTSGTGHAKGGFAGFKRYARGTPHARSGHAQPRSPHGPRFPWRPPQGQLTAAGYESLLEQLDLSDAQSGVPDVGTRTQLLQGEIFVLEQQLKHAPASKKSGIRQALTPLYGQLRDLGASPADSGDTSDPNQALIDSNTALADAIQAQTEAIQAQTEALNAVKAEIKRRTDFAESLTAITGAEATRLLGDILSGHFGALIAQRTATPSWGAVST